MTSSPEQPRGRRRISFRRILLVALIVQLVAVGLAALWALRNLDEWAKQRVELELANALGEPVSFEEFDVGVVDLTVRFRGLHVGRPIDPQRPPPGLAVAVDRGEIRLGWRGLNALFRGKIRLAEVRIHAPQVQWIEPRPPRSVAPASTGDGLDLRIDRFRLEDGRARFRNGPERPVDVQVEDLRIRASTAVSGELEGRVAFRTTLEEPSLSRPLPIAVEGRLGWAGTRLEVVQLTADSADRFVLAADGWLDWSGQEVAYDVSLHVETELSALADGTSLDLPRLGGETTADVELSGTGAAWRASGDLVLVDAIVDRFRVQSLRARVEADPSRVRIPELDAALADGTASGEVEVELSDRPTWVATLDVGSVDARRLLTGLGVPLAVGGTAQGRVELSGPFEDPGAWTGTGTVRVRPRYSNDTVAVSGDGTLALADGRLSVSFRDVEAARATLWLDVGVNLDGPGPRQRLRIGGVTRDAEVTHRGVLTILDSLGVEVPDLVAIPISGRGGIEATVPFDGEDLDVRLDLEVGAWGPQPFELLQASVGWNGSELTLDEVRLLQDRSSLIGRARLSIGDDVDILELVADAQTLPVDPLLRLFEIDAGVTGDLTTSLEVLPGDDGLPRGGGTMEMRNATVVGEAGLSATARVEVLGPRWSFLELSATGEGFEVQGDVAFDVETSTVEIAADPGSYVDLAGLRPIADQVPELTGRVEFAGAADLGPEGWQGAVEVDAIDLTYTDRTMGEFEGTATVDGYRVTASLKAKEPDRWIGDFTLDLDEQMNLDARLTFDEQEFEPAPGQRPAVWTLLSGNLTATGPLARPQELTIRGRFDQFEVSTGSKTLTNDGPVDLEFVDGILGVGPLTWSDGTSSIALRLDYDTAADELSGSADGRLDLGLVSAVSPDLRGSGPIDVDLKLAGKPDDPSIQGEVTLSGGRLRMIDVQQTLEQIDLRMSFDGTRARLDRLSAVTGYGEIVGDGVAELDLSLFRFDISASNVKIAAPDGFTATYDADLALRDEQGRILIEGEVRMLRGLYDEPFALSGLLGGATREYGTEDEDVLPDDIFLDIDVVAEGDVRVRNELIEAEAEGYLHVGGELRRPEVTGRISILEDGTITFRRVEYRIQSGSLDLVDPDAIDPFITLRARTSVREYDVQLRVEGRIERFDYELTSNPPLSEQDIIALLTTGRTLEQLTTGGFDRAVTGDLATTYFAGFLTGRFETQLENALGVERVEINPVLVEGETDPTTRVTVAKEVTDDVSVIVSSDLGANERQLYQIEWKALRRLKLIAERDTTGGIGGDVQYTTRIDWRARRKQASDARTEPTVEPPDVDPSPTVDQPSIVSAIEIEGVDEMVRTALRERLPIHEGKSFRRSQVFQGTEAIRRYFVNRGRLRSRVRTELTPEAERRTRVRYLVEPGPEFDVRFEGVKNRDEKRLRQLLRDLWTQSLFTEDFFVDSTDEVRDYYADKGYYTADVHHDLTDASPRVLTFVVDRGKRIRVAEVVIEGAEHVPEERIRKQMLTRPGSLFSRQKLDTDVLRQDIAAIRNLYRDLGYQAVRVADPRIRLASTADRATVRLTIDEGPRFDIRSITYPDGGAFDSQELREWAGLEVGAYYARSKLIEAESNVRRGFDRRGYPDARVRSEATFDETAVDVAFSVMPGGQKRVGSIRIVGNDHTKERVIRRQLALKDGDLLTREKIVTTQAALYRLGIFRSVRLEYSPEDPEKSIDQRLTVRVDEAAPVTVTVGAGYDTENRGQLNFAVTHSNLAGRDRVIGFQSFTSSILERYQVVASQPTLFGASLPTLMSVAYEDREETGFSVLRRSFAARVDRKFSRRWSGFLRYNLQQVDVRDVTDTSVLVDERIENLELGDIGLTVVRDTRDDLLVPTRGSYFSLTSRLFSEALLSESSFVKSTGTFSHVITFPDRTAYAAAVRIGLINTYGNTDTVPISERFFAGGDSTLRGFPRDEVGPRDGNVPLGGQGLLVINNEFRFPLTESLRGVLFYDTGNVYGQVQEFDPFDVRHVLGVGLRLETPIGPFRLEYGRILDRQEGEKKGRLFVAIGTLF